MLSLIIICHSVNFNKSYLLFIATLLVFMIILSMFDLSFIMHLFQKEFILKLLLLALLYSIIPLSETFLLLHLGGLFGNYLILALAATTGLIGLFIAFSEVSSIIGSIKIKLKEGVYPGKEFISLAGVLTGALLLLTPGFITDTLGLLLFIPFFRNGVGKFITSKMENSLKEIYEYLKLYELE